MKNAIRQPRNQKATVKTAIPGPLSNELRQREDEHLAPGLQNFALLAGIAVLLRVFLTPGAAAGDAVVKAHAALTRILQIAGAPVWSQQVRWERGLPRYPTHHQSHVAAARRALNRLPPLAIAGAGYDGAGVSACARSGREAATEILRRAS